MVSTSRAPHERRDRENKEERDTGSGGEQTELAKCSDHHPLNVQQPQRKAGHENGLYAKELPCGAVVIYRKHGQGKCDEIGCSSEECERNSINFGIPTRENRLAPFDDTAGYGFRGVVMNGEINGISEPEKGY